jgi:3',5'-cyclic AMP phosphodiesterase CpdA
MELGGEHPAEVPLGDIFLVRLGDWVDAHASRYLHFGANRLTELGDIDRSAITFPDSMPSPPPFRPLEPVPVRPPTEPRFRFAILGDLHCGSAEAEATARAAIRGINASGAALTVQLGDLTDHGDRDEFEIAHRLLHELDMPCFTMMGNHDVYSYRDDRLTGREYYSTSFGHGPDGMLVEHDGFRFAVLDSAEHGTSPFPPFNLVTGTFMKGRGGAVVGGVLTPAQHELLAQIAEPGGPPAFVFLHHPPQPFTGFPPVLFGLRDQDSGRLHAACDSGNVWGVFAGHTHRNARTRTFGSVVAQEVGIPRDFPFGYALVDVSDKGFAYRFAQLSDHSLLRRLSESAGAIHRRYAQGRDHERGFVWRRG